MVALKNWKEIEVKAALKIDYNFWNLKKLIFVNYNKDFKKLRKLQFNDFSQRHHFYILRKSLKKCATKILKKQ